MKPKGNFKKKNWGKNWKYTKLWKKRASPQTNKRKKPIGTKKQISNG